MIHLLGQTILTSLYTIMIYVLNFIIFSVLLINWNISFSPWVLVKFAHMHSYWSSSLPYLIVPVLNQYITEGTKLFPSVWVGSSLPYLINRTSIEPVYHRGNKAFPISLSWFVSPIPYQSYQYWTSIEPVYHRGNKAGGEDYRSLLIININS